MFKKIMHSTLCRLKVNTSSLNARTHINIVGSKSFNDQTGFVSLLTFQQLIIFLPAQKQWGQ